MNNDLTFELILQGLEETSKAWSFTYAVIDMRGMMKHLHGDRSVLSSILSPAELERFDQYALPKKKLQWLAGRFAVKTALIRHRAGDPNLEMSSIDVFNNENSAPYILQFPEIHLSITHSFPYCIGVIANHPIGIDLEKIITPRKAMFDLFFHPNEIRSLPNQGEIEEYQYVAMAYWTRKEALSKLLGLGMKVCFRNLETIGDELVLNEFSQKRVCLKSHRCLEFVCSIAMEDLP